MVAKGDGLMKNFFEQLRQSIAGPEIKCPLTYEQIKALPWYKQFFIFIKYY